MHRTALWVNLMRAVSWREGPAGQHALCHNAVFFMHKKHALQKSQLEAHLESRRQSRRAVRINIANNKRTPPRPGPPRRT